MSVTNTPTVVLASIAMATVKSPPRAVRRDADTLVCADAGVAGSVPNPRPCAVTGADRRDNISSAGDRIESSDRFAKRVVGHRGSTDPVSVDTLRKTSVVRDENRSMLALVAGASRTRAMWVPPLLAVEAAGEFRSADARVGYSSTRERRSTSVQRVDES